MRGVFVSDAILTIFSKGGTMRYIDENLLYEKITMRRTPNVFSFFSVLCTFFFSLGIYIFNRDDRIETSSMAIRWWWRSGKFPIFIANLFIVAGCTDSGNITMFSISFFSLQEKYKYACKKYKYLYNCDYNLNKTIELFKNIVSGEK